MIKTIRKAWLISQVMYFDPVSQTFGVDFSKTKQLDKLGKLGK